MTVKVAHIRLCHSRMLFVRGRAGLRFLLVQLSGRAGCLYAGVRPREEGQVENQVGLGHERFFTPGYDLRFNSYDELNAPARPEALRNGAPFKDWVLPAAMKRMRRKL